MTLEEWVLMVKVTISPDSKIWAALVTWVVSAIWVEIKTLNFHLTERTWVEWEEWIRAKFFLCLWVEEEEDSEVLEISVVNREENLQKKHRKQKVVIKNFRISGVFLLVILILTTSAQEVLDHSVGTFNKKISSKNDF